MTTLNLEDSKLSVITVDYICSVLIIITFKIPLYSLKIYSFCKICEICKTFLLKIVKIVSNLKKCEFFYLSLFTVKVEFCT